MRRASRKSHDEASRTLEELWGLYYFFIPVNHTHHPLNKGGQSDET
jgi:hypothetical protein